MNSIVIEDLVKSINAYINVFNLNSKYNKINGIIKAKENSDYEIDYLIEVLIYNYDFPSNIILPTFFELFDDLQQNSMNSNWIAFAEFSGYDYYYSFDLKSDEVFLVNLDDNTVSYYCAPNMSLFLSIISKAFEQELLYNNSVDQSTIDSSLTKTFKNCFELVNNDKRYEAFLKLLLGVV